MAGALGEGHIPSEGLREFARITKKDGFVVMVMRKEYLTKVKEYADRLEPLMDKMEAEQVWTKIARIEVPKYSFNNVGVVYIYKKN